MERIAGSDHAARTRMPRPSIVKPTAGLIVVGAIITARLYMISGGDPAVAFAPLLAAIVISAGITALYYATNAPVPTWVGLDSVAVGARRWLGDGAAFAFEDLEDVELITSHAYLPPAPGEPEPRYRALLYRLCARTRAGAIALAFEGEAPYRTPGRYDDADDRAPATFAHLDAGDPYWFARAVEAGWMSWLARYARE